MYNMENLKEFYKQCKLLEFTDLNELILKSDSKEEAEFYRTISDFILQQKQKQVILEKRF
ncbi:MAG: hypothetical protein IJ583_07900 [Firmicutes bacterium]|nr:hypothetical protein [Bacillota bacterium]